MGESVREILRSPPLVAQAIGFSGLVFVLVGYLTWMPTMLAEKFDLSLASAGFQSVAWHHIFGYLGLLMAGRELEARDCNIRGDIRAGRDIILSGCPVIGGNVLAGRSVTERATVQAKLAVRVNSEIGRTEYLLVGLVPADDGLAAGAGERRRRPGGGAGS